jgi:DNA modification methylase
MTLAMNRLTTTLVVVAVIILVERWMIEILAGDCRETLKTLADQSINTCITSPPYWGLRDYGEGEQLGMEDTPEEFVNNLVEVFREVKRVLRSDGTVWLNLGDSYCGTGNKGNHTDPKHKEGRSGQKIALNNKVEGLKSKDLVGIPWRVAFALQQDGWYLRQDIIWHKPNPMPESVKDRCTKAHEYIFLLSKSPKYYFDNEAIKEDAKTEPALRNKMGEGYQADYTKGKRFSDGERVWGSKKRNKRSVWTVTTKPFKGAHFATFPMDLIEPCVLAGCPEKVCVACGKSYERVMQRPKQLDVERNKRSGLDDRKIGGVLDKYNRENPSIDLGLQKQCDCETNETKPGTVLDPFGGSGTTGQIADGHNRNAILCELNPEYIEISKKRLGVGTDLFSEVEVKHD